MARFLYKGIMLQQHKEPALSRELREFLNADTIGVRMEQEPIADYTALSPDEVIALAERAKIVDERDGCPLAEKLLRARAFSCHLLMVDAIDDEPYISSQINPMLKNPQLSEIGLTLCKQATGSADACFAIYKNLSDIETKPARKIGDYPVIRLRGRYPAEFQATGDYCEENGVLVVGAGSVIHLARAALFNKPQNTAFVTVAGDCISNPTNLEVSLGMTIAQTLERCGLLDEPARVVISGSMTGISVIDTENTLITPTTRSILAFRMEAEHSSYRCIGCARCVSACPKGLNPFLIYRSILHNRQDQLRRLDASMCISCGACSYMCPAKLDLSAMIRQAVDDSEEKHADIQKSQEVLLAYKSAVYENYLANHLFGKAVSTHRKSRHQLLRDLKNWQLQSGREHAANENRIRNRLAAAATAQDRAFHDADQALEAARRTMHRTQSEADQSFAASEHTRDIVYQSADRALREAGRRRETTERAAEKQVLQSVDFQYQMSLSIVKDAERALHQLEKQKDPSPTAPQLNAARDAVDQARKAMDESSRQTQSNAEQNCIRTKQDAEAAFSQATVICARTKQDADQSVEKARQLREQAYEKARIAFDAAQVAHKQAKQVAQEVYAQAEIVYQQEMTVEQVRFDQVQTALKRRALIRQAVIDETLHLVRFQALAAAHKAAAARAAVSSRSCLADDYEMPTHLRSSEYALLSPTLRLPFDREGYPKPGSDVFREQVEKKMRKLLEMPPEQIAAAIRICTESLANPPAEDAPEQVVALPQSEQTKQATKELVKAAVGMNNIAEEERYP